MITLLLLMIVVALVSALLWRRAQFFKHFELRGIKGPKPHILFGNALEIWRKGHPVCCIQWRKEYGDVFGYFNGAMPVIVVCDKEIVKEVFVKQFPLFVDRPDLFSVATNHQQNLSALKGDKWRRVRATLTPTFTMKKLRDVSGDMSKIVSEFVHHLERWSVIGEKFDVHHILQALTTDIISRVGLGLNYGAIKDPTNPMLSNIASVFMINYNLFLVVLISFPTLLFVVRPILKIFGNLKSQLRRKMNPGFQIMEDCEQVVRSRRQNPAAKRRDVLQMFLDAKGQKTEDEYLTVCDETENRRSLESVSGPPLSDPEVLDNAWLMMLAGFETTAATLAAICFTLMRRVDVQNKMRQELYQIFHEKKSIDFDSVQKLPYMDAVIKEALRLYPPAFHVARYAVQDAELPGGLVVKEGDTLLVPIPAVHLREDYFEHPHDFRPERFIHDEVDPATFLSFGLGPRNCIGMRFAQMGMKLTLAKLLMHYRIEPVTETPEIFHMKATCTFHTFTGPLYAKVSKLERIFPIDN